MTNQQNRRQFWRAHFNSPVYVAMHGRTTEAVLQDISLKGALIEVPANWLCSNGDTCQIRLRLGSDTIISMHCTVAHIDGQRLGLCCDTIDLDSATHLRRLVELNAGDSSLLERELSALLQEAG